MIEAPEEGKDIWVAQEGFQKNALSHTWVKELLLTGPRGSGKSDVLIVDFCQFIDKGFNDEYVGVIVRKTFPQLRDLFRKARQIITPSFPQATFTTHPQPVITFPKGETLIFQAMENPEDYEKIHGFNVSYIGVDEVSEFADDVLWNSSQSTLRTKVKGLPLRIRGATNPHGVGHQWIKNHFALPGNLGKIVKVQQKYMTPEGEKIKTHYRLALHCDFYENMALRRSHA